MKAIKDTTRIVLLIVPGWLLLSAALYSQEYQEHPQPGLPDPMLRAYDSLLASRIPVLDIPADYSVRSLPSVLDNSTYIWFPDILDQHMYFACQQYAGCSYTFAYEMNRLRNLDGNLPGNRYPAHYTWHFYNCGEQFFGVNFLHSFHAMMEQGHMTLDDFGPDTALLSKGWVTGYDKYYKAAKNRLRKISRIQVNSSEGILAVKNYLFDHFDGSATGGVVCFTSSSPTALPALPAGTPEAGKAVLVNWNPWPTHGMTIVGYNDSIRYDLNEDGQYTNHIDINGDGKVDAKDWEIGGFLIANSYGAWWANQGYFYVMYHAMACDFEEGGVWNNCVYVLEPDPGYSPLLTVGIDLEHTRRNQVSIIAGISMDTAADLPEYILTLPFFSYQGGTYYMQGFNTLPGQKRIEIGLDVSPLLSFAEPGAVCKLFLIVEERDTFSMGQGIIHDASFYFYGNPVLSFPCKETEMPMTDNGITILSASGQMTFTPPEIGTEELPPLSSGSVYQTQLQATSGTPPYEWRLAEHYLRIPSAASYDPFTDQQLAVESSGKPFATVPLPFPFPFYGKKYDTVYVNASGFIHLTPDHVPYPYLSNEVDMLDFIPSIFPFFSYMYYFNPQEGDGMWMKTGSGSVSFRWQLSYWGWEAETDIEFIATLFPDGQIDFCYGPIATGESFFLSYAGMSDGKKHNRELIPVSEPETESGKSYRWLPPFLPEEISISENGMLKISGADSTRICDISVRVTDQQRISREKSFQLSDGLFIEHTLESASGVLQYQEPATLSLRLVNQGVMDLSGIRIALNCTDTAFLISDSTEVVSSLTPGQTVSIPDAFSLLLTRISQGNTPALFSIIATKDAFRRERPVILDISAPFIQPGKFTIHDGVNQLLDPGETAELLIPMSNTGNLSAANLSVQLSVPDTLITILSDPVLMLPELRSKDVYTASFLLRASRFILPETTDTLSVHITNHFDVDLSWKVPLQLGTQPVALINLAGVTSTPARMASILDSLQVGYSSFDAIPGNLYLYPACFLILGTSTSGSHNLTDKETGLIGNYLLNGGNLYMESYNAWYFAKNEPLKEWFRYSSDRVDLYGFQEPEGVLSTFTEGMSFLYMGSTPVAIFEVVPEKGGYSVFDNSDEPPKSLQFAYAGDYKTIGTFLEFGKLVDSEPPSTGRILMEKYLEFFDVNRYGPWPFFHADTSHICRWHQVQFTDDSFENITSRLWEFPGGTPSSSTDENPEVTYDQPGNYNVSLTVSDGVNSRTLERKSYIRVELCTAIENRVTENSVRIYPNPASGMVMIELPDGISSQVGILIRDYQGRIRKTLSVQPVGSGCKTMVSVSDLPSGLYVVQVISGNFSGSGKLIVHHGAN